MTKPQNVPWPHGELGRFVERLKRANSISRSLIQLFSHARHEPISLSLTQFHYVAEKRRYYQRTLTMYRANNSG